MSRINYLVLMHKDDALHAAWEAYLNNVPMSWITY